VRRRCAIRRVGGFAGQLIACARARRRHAGPAASASAGRSKDKARRRGGVGIRRLLPGLTTLSGAFPAAAILDLYRLRWQIDWCLSANAIGLVTYPRRTLSAPKLGWKANCSRTLIERMVRSAETFSPWGYALAGPTQQVARVEFMYRQVGAALLLPQSLATVLRQWRAITRGFGRAARGRRRYGFD